MKTKALQILFNVLMVALFVGLMLFIVYGCVPRGSVPPAPGIHGRPGDILIGIGGYAIWAGGAGLILCAFAAWAWPNKYTVAKAAIGCATLIGAGAIVYQLGQHLGLAVGLSLLGALGAGVWWCLHHLARVEKALGVDLNRNGKVGA